MYLLDISFLIEFWKVFIYPGYKGLFWFFSPKYMLCKYFLRTSLSFHFLNYILKKYLFLILMKSYFAFLLLWVALMVSYPWTLYLTQDMADFLLFSSKSVIFFLHFEFSCIKFSVSFHGVRSLDWSVFFSCVWMSNCSKIYWKTILSPLNCLLILIKILIDHICVDLLQDFIHSTDWLVF